MMYNRAITQTRIEEYVAYLYEQERSAATIRQYVQHLNAAADYFSGDSLTKATVIQWKKHLTDNYAVSSVNTMLAALNGFFKFVSWNDLCVKALKVQKTLFCSTQQELTHEEYIRLVQAAEQQNNQRLSLLLQTICSTGIRVSELQFITAEAVQNRRAEITNKGKCRTIFLSNQLCKKLREYFKKNGIVSGPVFVTRTGKPLHRSNIWRDMKKLCATAGVADKKVFLHNLRHLFARRFYSMEKDLSRLADILGHSSVNTTRIYTVESGAVHARQIEELGLVIPITT